MSVTPEQVIAAGIENIQRAIRTIIDIERSCNDYHTHDQMLDRIVEHVRMSIIGGIRGMSEDSRMTMLDRLSHELQADSDATDLYREGGARCG